MAVIKGIKENVHLPLYDSLFVRPQQQLREVQSSSVFKFFVHVQGKTKLETNMQAAALLPHWNTFEAHSLRVVVSDLPVRLPEIVTQCLTEPKEKGINPTLANLTHCLGELSEVITNEKGCVAEQWLAMARQGVCEYRDVIEHAAEINDGLDEGLGVFASLCNQETMGNILQLHSELRVIAGDLITILRRTRASVSEPEAMSRFLSTITTLSDTEEDTQLFGKVRKAQNYLPTFSQLVALCTQLKQTSLPDAQLCVENIEQLIQAQAKRVKCLQSVQQCFENVQAQIAKLDIEAPQRSSSAIHRCLQEHVRNQLQIPLDEQLFARNVQLLAKLIYQSVTSFIVGEKIMIQMPTWFFPAGAGPYAEDGQVVTHGFPTPDATFHFAEPVLIDAQQNFRVELEIPDATVLSEIQRIYGPMFIWVVLDGYMQRDVQ